MDGLFIVTIIVFVGIVLLNVYEYWLKPRRLMKAYLENAEEAVRVNSEWHDSDYSSP